MKKSIVIIGGGTGTSTLLSGLKKFEVNLTAVVSSSDDGGSSGILRKELGVFPPGDLRQCLLALSDAPQSTKDLFHMRFSQGALKGHNLGNLIIAGAEKLTGGVSRAVLDVAELLQVTGRVLPVTLNPTTLVAELSNGKKIIGEHNIDERKNNLRFKIKDLRLERQIKANPEVIKALTNADLIVFGPGDLYTSVFPNLLVPGIVNAIHTAKAKKVFVINIMTKPGQTDGFTAFDFVSELKKYLRGDINAVVINTKKPAPALLERYRKAGAKFVELNKKTFLNKEMKILKKDLLSDIIYKRSMGDVLERSFIRHDPDKLAKVIYDLL